MSLKGKRNSFYNARKWFTFFICTSLLMALTGCTLGNTYKAPEVTGELLSFIPENKPQFIAVSGAKIYHKAYPEMAVYSDEQGKFLLPTVIEVEARLIMPGHAMTRYPIVIELKNISYNFFVHSTLNSRYLEEFNLHSIIIPNLVNSNIDGIKGGLKAAWPCDLQTMKNLEQAIGTAKQLAVSFPNRATMTRTQAYYVNNNYSNAFELLHQAKNSCQWQVRSTPTQRAHLLETRNYFSEVNQLLKTMNPAQTK